MNSIPASVSIGGFVFGMHTTDVNPPAAAAAVPVAIVSRPSWPGSRRWTCMSMKPGTTHFPAASMVRPFPAFAFFAISLIFEPSITRSAR